MSWPDDVPRWKLYLGFSIMMLAIILRNPTIKFMLSFMKRLFGERGKCINDVQRYLSKYLSWIVLLLWFYLAFNLFGLTKSVGRFIRYVIGIPVILATGGLRIVITNIVIRHYGWERQSQDDFGRILMVTEGIGLVAYFFIFVEFLFFYLSDFDFSTVVIMVIVAMLESSLALSFYTTLKNFMAGLSLVFSEPFGLGSYCRFEHIGGFVQSVTLSKTIIRRHDGGIAHIPNGIIIDKYLQNQSFSKKSKIEIVVKLSSKTSMDKIDLLINSLKLSLSSYAISGSLNGESVSNPVMVNEVSPNADTSFERLSTRSSTSPKSLLTRVIRSLSQPLFELETLDDISESAETILSMPLQVVLSGMYRVLVSLSVTEVQLRDVALMKTKIILDIIRTAERLGIHITQ